MPGDLPHSGSQTLAVSGPAGQGVELAALMSESATAIGSTRSAIRDASASHSSSGTGAAGALKQESG